MAASPAEGGRTDEDGSGDTGIDFTAGQRDGERDVVLSSSEAAGGPDRVTRLIEWLFLTGDRAAIAAGLLVGVYLLLTVMHVTVGSISVDRTAPMFYVFSALAGGNFTLITIIVSINQLVVSRQLSTPSELHEQIQDTNVYREEIEDALPEIDVAPVTPTEFLHVLLRSTMSSIEAIQEIFEKIEDHEAREELQEAGSKIRDHVAHVETMFARSEVDLFSALAATLTTNYSMDIHRLRQLRADYPEAYADGVYDHLNELVARLQQIDIARQYIKTLYLQNELSRLSRHLLYVGVPAILSSLFMLRLFSVGAQTLTPADLFAFIPLAIVVSVAPIAILFSYVHRLSTVARRTVAITPFTTTTQEVRDRRSL